MTHSLRLAVMAGALASACASAGAATDHAAPEPGQGEQVVALLGLAVQGTGGTEIGHVVDVVIDADAHPRAAVVDVGGFMGMGNRRVAIDWKLLRLAMGKTPVVQLAVPSERIKSAPAYDPDKPVEIFDATP